MPDHGNWQKGDSLDGFCKSDGNWDSFQFIIFAATEPAQIKFPECISSHIRLDCMLKGIQGNKGNISYWRSGKRRLKNDSHYLVALYT